MNKVFVYGILKGRPAAKAATVKAFRLIDMGAFPAAIPSEETDVVKGELIEVDDNMIEEFDRIEGTPTFYTRDKVRVTIEGGEEVDAEMYVINNSYWENPSNASIRLTIQEMEEVTTHEYHPHIHR